MNLLLSWLTHCELQNFHLRDPESSQMCTSVATDIYIAPCHCIDSYKYLKCNYGSVMIKLIASPSFDCFGNAVLKYLHLCHEARANSSMKMGEKLRGVGGWSSICPSASWTTFSFKILFIDLQDYCEDNTESLHIPYIQHPLLLTSLY